MLEKIPWEKAGDYILVVEGAIPARHFGVMGEMPMEERLRTLVNGALAVVAVGTCAAYGGIPAAWPNPTAARGVGDFLRADHLKAPVINVPGCPPHPRWFVETLAHLFLYGLPSPEDLDPVGRLKVVYPSLVHEQCPRRADFDVGRFAKSSGESGCLYELG